MPCSVRIFKTIWGLKWTFWTSKFSRDLYLKWVSDWYPICNSSQNRIFHDDFMLWKHFSRHWPFVWGIHRSPEDSPYKPIMWSFYVFSINRLLDKQPSCRWLQTLSGSEVTVIKHLPWVCKSPFPRSILGRVQLGQIFGYFSIKFRYFSRAGNNRSLQGPILVWARSMRIGVM